LATEAARAGAPAIGRLVYLGAFPTALGFATWTFALRRTSAGRMGSITYPIWALLGETPSWAAAAGGALCLAGVWIARRRGS